MLEFEGDQAAHRGIKARIVRVEAHGLLDQLAPLFGAPGVHHDPGHLGISVGIIGVDLDRPQVGLDRLLEAPLPQVYGSHGEVDLALSGIEFDCEFAMFLGEPEGLLGRGRPAGQEVRDIAERQIRMGASEVRIERQRLLEIIP